MQHSFCPIFLLLFILLSAVVVDSNFRHHSFTVRSAIRAMNIIKKTEPSVFKSSVDLRTGSPIASACASDVDADITKRLSSPKLSIFKISLGIWAIVQVVSVLLNALKRLYPIAAQPFIQKDMLPLHWVLYVSWTLYMLYAEGYKGFQLKFAPLVVSRAFSLSQNLTIINCLFAGPYSMGLFGASRKRMIVSWAITIGVFALVILVKMLPYPYRSIIDAGVVAGLSYGTLSILVIAAKTLFGGHLEVPE